MNRTAEDLRRLAQDGPAFPAIASRGPVDWALWGQAASALGQALSGAPDLERRIHHLYLPVLFFCIAEARARSGRPVVIGLQAPQGAGKTTLVTHLLDLLPLAGLKAAAVSIDDFYLPREGQLAVAASHPGNRYLEHRGYPGTHDVALGDETLNGLRQLGGTAPGTRGMDLPVYDKSAHGGRGDRAAPEFWRRVEAPLDVVLLEGWMLGFEPVPESALEDRDLAAPNRALAAYGRWLDQLDAFVVLRALDPTYVLSWRVEAEEAMKARGLPGLDRAAIEDYVQRFLPAYRTFAGRAPARLGGRELAIHLDRLRRPAPAPASG